MTFLPDSFAEFLDLFYIFPGAVREVFQNKFPDRFSGRFGGETTVIRSHANRKSFLDSFAAPLVSDEPKRAAQGCRSPVAARFNLESAQKGFQLSYR